MAKSDNYAASCPGKAGPRFVHCRYCDRQGKPGQLDVFLYDGTYFVACRRPHYFEAPLLSVDEEHVLTFSQATTSEDIE